MVWMHRKTKITKKEFLTKLRSHINTVSTANVFSGHRNYAMT